MVSSKIFVVAAIIIGVAIVAAVAALQNQTSTKNQTSSDNNSLVAEPTSNTGRLQAGDIITLSDGQKAIAFPLVEGFYKGKTLLFIHTDASDPNVATMMTMMVNYTTQYSPKIANVSDDALAAVYVFENGVKGANPFGFQSDVFDSVPIDSSYSPLRRVILVKWNENAQPRELKSVEEITAARDNGDLTLAVSDKVVIMPILQWDSSLGGEPATSDGIGSNGGSMSGSMKLMR